MDTIDSKFVEETIDRIGRDESMLIPILQAIQQQYRYLPQEALERVCQLTRITPARIDGVTSFYSKVLGPRAHQEYGLRDCLIGASGFVCVCVCVGLLSSTWCGIILPHTRFDSRPSQVGP